MNTIFKGLALAAVAAAIASSPASAASISGNINLVGDFSPTIGGTDTTNLATATGVDFLPFGTGTAGTFNTGSANGNLSAFAFQNGGSISDFTFAPSSSMNNFYNITVGGQTLSFDLTGLQVVTQNATFLTLQGTGTLHLTGFDATPGVWNFSGQASSNGDFQTTLFSWSAGSSSTSVPEPASLSLLGLGFVAAGWMRRRNALKTQAI